MIDQLIKWKRTSGICGNTELHHKVVSRVTTAFMFLQQINKF